MQLSLAETIKICFTVIRSWCKWFKRINQQKAASARKEKTTTEDVTSENVLPFPSNQ